MALETTPSSLLSPKKAFRNELKANKSHKEKSLAHLFYWIKFTLTFVIFSVILLCCSPRWGPYSPKIEADIPQGFSKDCRIPKSAEIIHYPMIHNVDELFTEGMHDSFKDFMEDPISYSQFQMAHTINSQKDTALFLEGLTQTIKREYVQPPSKFKSVLFIDALKKEQSFFDFDQHIKNLFDHSLPSEYESLNKEQKQIFLEMGGAYVAFSLEMVDQIHPTNNPKKRDEIYSQIKPLFKNIQALKKDYLQMFDRFEKENSLGRQYRIVEDLENLSYKINAKEKEMDVLIFDQRELILKKEIENFIIKTKDPFPIFIAYGGAHDFSDEFEEYEFYTLPVSCAMPQNYISHPSFAKVLISKADRLLNEKKPFYRQNKQVEKYYKQAYRILQQAVADQSSDHHTYWNYSIDRPYKQSELKQLEQIAYNKYKGIDEDVKGIPFLALLMSYSEED